MHARSVLYCTGMAGWGVGAVYVALASRFVFSIKSSLHAAEPYNTGTSVLKHHSSCSHEPVFEPDLMIVGSRSTPSEAEPER